jgi:hypothetical protein
MITFKKFLSEADAPIDLADFIIDNCRPFLSEVDGDPSDPFEYPLYRGLNPSDGDKKVKLNVDGEIKTCLIKTARTDRKPLDTHPQISKLIDDQFNEKFGWKPRSQGVFCFSKERKHGATDFGKLHQIVPIGNFKYLWNPAIPDLTYKIFRLHGDIKVPKRPPNLEYSAEDLAKIAAETKSIIGEYQDGELGNAIYDDSGMEIMLGCKTYLAIPL